MKKSNVTFIAAALIAVHVVVFVLAIGLKGDEKSPKPSKTASKPQATQSADPVSLPDFEVPKLAIPDAPPLAPMPKAPEPAPAPAVTPVEVPQMRTSAPRETIATAGNRDGYLRSDRPNKRTRQVFAELKNDPYQSAIVVDARTGKILYENRASVYSYPASVTKLMTMLIVLEQIDAGQVSLNDRVKITKEIAGIGGSGVYLDTRESGEFTVEHMLQAVMIHSANDAAAALAVHVAGSIDGFVDMMNQKARDISTAYDIAILSLAALHHPETIKYTSTKLAYLPLSNIRTEKFMLANRNALVGKAPYQGCDGLKTGYHSKGGSSLAATAKRGNNRVIAVALGCPNKTVRDTQIRKLLDKGFEKLK
jgi:D-alanyl-D-alanine carboxypeptidase